MLILDWMKTNLITITPKTSLLQCRKLLKEKHISRLPVVDNKGIVIGLLTEAGINAFAPQRATGLEVLQLYEVLEETTAAEVMKINPTTIHYQGTIAQAAMKMVENRVSCLPVVNDDEKLVGILTDWDIFMALVNITTGGALADGVEICFNLPKTRGSLRAILDELSELKVSISTVLTNTHEDGSRVVKVQFFADDPAVERAALDKLKGHDGLRYWAYNGEMYIADRPDLKM